MESKPGYAAILATGTREQDVVDDLDARINKAIEAGYTLHSITYFISSSQMTIGPIHNFLAHMTRVVFYRADAERTED